MKSLASRDTLLKAFASNETSFFRVFLMALKRSSYSLTPQSSMNLMSLPSQKGS